MGSYWSSAVPQDEPDKYVIVPPIVALDRSQRNRMCYSSYDWLFSKRELAFLMESFLSPGPSAVLHLSPPADRRFLVSTNLGSPYSNRITNQEALRRALKDCTGGLSVRFQGDANNPLSFAELNVSHQVRISSLVPRLNACQVRLGSQRCRAAGRHCAHAAVSVRAPRHRPRLVCHRPAATRCG